MKKVKVLVNGYAASLERDVNEFIEKHPNIIDIQYRVTSPYNYVVTHTAMIVYEDGDSN